VFGAFAHAFLEADRPTKAQVEDSRKDRRYAAVVVR
jgi:hypothetical protein